MAILDAGRNALSFFLLLVVSLGLSVVRESLGRTMFRCQILAVAHFVFGGKSLRIEIYCSVSPFSHISAVLYAVGIVELELESTSAFVLLLFVVPLAFTLSGFLIWILYALHGMSISSSLRTDAHFISAATINQLAARKQRYKLSMFTWLYRILLMTVIVIAIFFIVSSFVFSGRLAEGTRCDIPGVRLLMSTVRLWREVLESTMVAPRRVAHAALLDRLYSNWLSLEALAK